MCGIVGFVSKEKNSKLLIDFVDNISHRGPDKSGYKIIKVGDSYLHLGSARLSIRGLDDGDMPMEDEFGNLITYNGELYQLNNINVDNLNTTSDTRVLLNHLNRNDVSNLDNLNGMFSFAFYNNKKKKVTLARDSLGVKPLYYYQNSNFPLVFSSELKPLLIFKNKPSTTSENKIKELIYLGKNSLDSTIVDNIKFLEPGYYLEYNFKQTDKKKFKSYFDNSTNSLNKNNTFLNVFNNSLEDQLTADVPVDILLSGGIDSSAIAIVAKKHLNKSVNAFNLSYSKSQYDENSAASLISNELGINLRTINFDINNNNSIIEELMLKLPEPILDPSIVGTYYLSKEVSKHTKSVISGDGADELFGGYSWHKLYMFPSLFNRLLPDILIKIVDIYSKNSESYVTFSDKLKIYKNISTLPIEKKILYIQNFLLNSKKEIEDMNDLHTRYLKELNIKNTKTPEILREIDMKSYLYTNILKKSDTASMLNGLEIRPVFLDDRIIKYALAQPFENNISAFSSKIDIRNLVSRFNKDLASRKKHGFPHDFGDWTQNVGLPYLKNNWSDLDLVNKYLKGVEENNISSYHLSRSTWKIFSVLKWIDVNRVKIN